ncbi:MAG: hypothetical protein JWR36_1026 [Glaciihabitans sp.]|jgi:hypothetical protein|nr:hypothetical protein [Glaciihabitans sp.]MDQ1572064.1 hypothetical protein [Actinomycetota bacterium]
MTTARISANSHGQTALDQVVARLAGALLRWANRRATRASITHEEMVRLRANEAATAPRPFYSTLVP